jgi:hypothetical protein
MSIYGLGNPGINRTTTQLPVRDNTRTPAQTPSSLPAPSRLVTQTPGAAKNATSAVPAEPPAGTDPALWSVLSGEERAFFAKAGAMGPLTYGRAFSEMKAAQIPANRGGRLDIKI